MPRALLVLTLVALLWQGWPRQAVAAPPGEILSLGVTQEGEARGKVRAAARELEAFLTRELADHLMRSGTMSRLAAAEDRSCRDQGCMERLIKRSGAVALLGSDVKRNGDNSYYITTWLYDAERHELMDDNKNCEPCDRGQLAETVNASAGVLLVRRNAPVVEAPPQPRLPAAATVAPPTMALPTVAPRPSDEKQPVRPCPRTSRCRIAIDVALGALTIGGLVTMGVMLSKNGQPSPGPCSDLDGMMYNAGCTWNFYKRHMIPGFGAAGGAAALGLILSVAIP